MNATLKSGVEVFWTQVDWLGDVVRVVRARTVGQPFIVTRNDLQAIECVRLDCNRVAPTSRLSRVDPELAIERPAVESRRQSPRSSPEPTSNPKPEQRPAATMQSGTSEASPVDVLAFDFMNLFVRAWHAGKPTDRHAVKSMFQTVAQAVRTLKPSRIVFAMDGGHTHRSQLLPAYKAHRPPHPPELIAQRQIAEECIRIARLPAFFVEGFEADDILSSLVDRCPAMVICSSDKDLLAMHGRCRIYHPWSGGSFVDPETKLGLPAGQVTDYLALCGDSSDGIPGVNGIGPKTAVALLKQYESLEAILAAAHRQLIPGAVGRKLREQRSAALMCREVVQLRSSLPLAEVPAWAAPAGLQEALQGIGLGSIAAILCGMKLSIIDKPILSVETPMDPPETAITETPAMIGSDVPGSAGWVTRSIDEPIRRGLSVSQLWKGADEGLIACWESGRESAGTEKLNPWKAGTVKRSAWQQGFTQSHLRVRLAEVNPTPVKAPQPVAQPSHVKARSLFE